MSPIVHPLSSRLHTSRMGWTTTIALLLLIIYQASLAGCDSAAPTVRLAFLGDIMPGRGIKLTDSSLAYLASTLSAADLALANLESPLTTSSPTIKSAYNLCTSPENARFLVQAGLDLVSIINNHNMDCGLEGFQETYSSLRSVGLIPIDSQGYEVSVNNIKLSFFAFEDITSPLNIDSAISLIRSARTDGSLVIVSMHWGAEYQAAASDRQHSIASQLSSAGANIIWGHHPHVLQPIEWLPADCSDSSDKNGCTLVINSLGNALFDQPGLADTHRSAILTVVLDDKGVSSIRADPFIFDPFQSLITAPDEATSDLILSRLHLP